MNKHVFIKSSVDAGVETRVRTPRRECRRCRHRTRPRRSYTGSTAVLEAELDLEVLPEAGETFPGENGPIPAGR